VCGADFGVHVIMNAAEYNHPLATAPEEGAEMAKLIATVADGINFRSERYGHRGGLQQPDRLLYPEPPLDLPPDLDWSMGGKGATIPFVERAKRKGVTVPMWTACWIDPELGEKALREGRLDFVGMTRRLLADPELPNKVREGRLDDIRPCTGCMHCFDCRNKNKKLECRVNATLGREIVPEFQFRPAERKKKVMVVGAGPAGMEAARVAASRGHQVTVYDKEPRVGGLVLLAAVVRDTETQPLVDLVAYLRRQLDKEKVSVRLGKEVNAALVRAEKPDVLIIAAGPAHTKIELPGAEKPTFVKIEKLHRQLKRALTFFSPPTLVKLTKWWMPVADSVVVMGGNYQGCELAEFLVKRGRQVVIAHNGPEAELGDGMTNDDLANLWPWFKLKRVTVWPEVEYLEVKDNGLKIRVPDRRVYLLEGKNVMSVQDWGPNEALVKQLEGLAEEAYVIGSCREPGRIVDAIREGAQVGFAV